MTTAAASAAESGQLGVLPTLISALFPLHDLSYLYPAPPARQESTFDTIRNFLDDVAMGMDLIDFLLSVGLMPLSRGLLRSLSGRGKPDYGLHILYLPWTAVHATDNNEHTLRRYHVQVRHVCASSKGYWLAVGSHQARWAVEILTRTAAGRAPRPWSHTARV